MRSYNELDVHMTHNKGNNPFFIQIKENGDNVRVTIREFFGKVLNAYTLLTNKGLGFGNRVLIYMTTSIEAAAYITACKRLGIVYSCASIETSVSTLEKRLHDLNVDCVITQDIGIHNGAEIKMRKNIEALVTHTKIYTETQQLGYVSGLDDKEWVQEAFTTHPIKIVDSNYPLFVSYTSGSTGPPKGIVHCHGGYTCGIKKTMNTVFDAKHTDVMYTIGSFGWITGQSYMLSGPMQMGMTSILMEGHVLYPHSLRFAEIIHKYNVTLLQSGSTFLRYIMSEGNYKSFEKYNLKSLRIATFCAEPVNKEVHTFAKKYVCPNFINSYWATEHGGIVWSLDIEHQTSSTTRSPNNYPLPWIHAKVVNEENTSLQNSLGDVYYRTVSVFVLYSLGRCACVYTSRMERKQRQVFEIFCNRYIFICSR